MSQYAEKVSHKVGEYAVVEQEETSYNQQYDKEGSRGRFGRRKSRNGFYVPIELKSWFLLGFCVFILLCFTALNIAVVAYRHSQRVQSHLDRRDLIPHFLALPHAARQVSTTAASTPVQTASTPAQIVTAVTSPGPTPVTIINTTPNGASFGSGSSTPQGGVITSSFYRPAKDHTNFDTTPAPAPVNSPSPASKSPANPSPSVDGGSNNDGARPKDDSSNMAIVAPDNSQPAQSSVLTTVPYRNSQDFSQFSTTVVNPDNNVVKSTAISTSFPNVGAAPPNQFTHFTSTINNDVAPAKISITSVVVVSGSTSTIVTARPASSVIAPVQLETNTVVISGETITTTRPAASAVQLETNTLIVSGETITTVRPVVNTALRLGSTTETMVVSGSTITTVQPIRATDLKTETLMISGTPVTTIRAVATAESDSPITPKPSAAPVQQFTYFQQWTNTSYFVGAYLSTFMAVVLSIIARSIFVRLEYMEPFYRLRNPDGASYADSLLMRYANDMLPNVIIDSAKSKHFVVFLGALLMILTTICTALSPDVLRIAVRGTQCGAILSDEDSKHRDCQPYLAMNVPLAGAVQAFLFLIFLLVAALIFILRRRQSGIFAESTSIAGVAVLLGDSNSTNSDSKSRDPSIYAESRSLSVGDADQYTIQRATDGSGRNHITRVCDGSTGQRLLEGRSMTMDFKKAKKEKKKPRWVLRLPILGSFVLFVIGVFILVVYYTFFATMETAPGFEKFIDSEGPGVKFFMMFLSLVLKFYWTALEARIRKSAPYFAMLSPEGASAEQSILMFAPSHPYTAVFLRQTWHIPLLALTTVVCLLSEILVITLANLPFTSRTAYKDWKITSWISVVILAIMVVAIIIIFAWRVKHRNDVFDPPKNIAGILRLLEHGDLPDELSSLGDADRSERDRIVRGWRHRFVLRKVEVDGGRLGMPWAIQTIRQGDRV